MKDVTDNIELIIADFQREYHINLIEEAYTMSTDRFFILLSGLSPKSGFIYKMAQGKKAEAETKQEEVSFEDMAAIFGNLK